MPKYSSRMEDYLKTMLRLVETKGFIRTRDLARELGIRPPSVTEMLGKLEKEGLAKHEKYRGAVLTEEGRRIAGLVRQRQETIEKLLRLMWVPEKSAHEDSCRLEHQLSPASLEQLKRFLKFLERGGEYERLRKDFGKLQKT